METVKKELYLVASGIWGQHSNPEKTSQNYADFISSFDPDGGGSLSEYLEHDDSRTTYDDLKKIADQKPNWLQIDPETSDYDNCHVSGSVMLTNEQAKEMEDVFYLQLMSDLI